MNIENTLSQMASCDFSAPMTVTIVYEDSDDEIKIERTTPKLCDDTYEPYQPDIQEDQEKRSDPVTESCENNVNLKRKNNYSQLDDSYEKAPKQRKVDNKSLLDSISVNSPNNVNNDKKIDRNSTNINETCNKTCNEKSNPNNRNEIYDAENKNTQDYDELNRYLNVLLDKVSESLLHVFEVYQEHVLNVNRSNDVLFAQASKKRYIRIKYHYYQLSYCTVVTVMLSRENDSKFVDTFLNNTVDMGKYLNINVTTEQIKPFYYEMLSWTKQKKDSKHLTPLLSYQLSLPPLQKPIQNPTVNCNLYQAKDSSSEIKITTVNNQNETIVLYSNLVRPPQVTCENVGVQSLRSDMTHQQYPVIDYDDNIRNNLIYNNQPEGLNRTTHLPRNSVVTNNNYAYINNLPESNGINRATHLSRNNYVDGNKSTNINYTHVQNLPENNEKNKTIHLSRNNFVEGNKATNINFTHAHNFPENHENNRTTHFSRNNFMEAIKSTNINYTHIQNLPVNNEKNRATHLSKNNFVERNESTNINYPHIHTSNLSETNEIIRTARSNKYNYVDINKSTNGNYIHSNILPESNGINKLTHLIRNDYEEENNSINYAYRPESNPMNLRFVPPPPYRESHQRNHNPSFNNMNHETVKNTEQIINPQNDFEMNRSSVSRDSGYIGSDNINSPEDNTLKETTPANICTPYITHVTSLNPKALQMLEGNCRVCNLLTKKKCLGCYQVHYCSYDCQKLDWHSHKLFCGHNLEARQLNDCNQNQNKRI